MAPQLAVNPVDDTDVPLVATGTADATLMVAVAPATMPPVAVALMTVLPPPVAVVVKSTVATPLALVVDVAAAKLPPAVPDWLTGRRLALASCRQEDLDAWLAGDDATHRREAGHFVRWAAAHKLTSVELPAVRWGGPSGVIDTESRWEQARWLLGDDTLKPEDRVAGLLVLLYAQWPAAISRLTLSNVEISDNEVRLHLGREPVVVPEPLAALLLSLLASRRGHAALGDEGTSPWLFPGGRPGHIVRGIRYKV